MLTTIELLWKHIRKCLTNWLWIIENYCKSTKHNRIALETYTSHLWIDPKWSRVIMNPSGLHTRHLRITLESYTLANHSQIDHKSWGRTMVLVWKITHWQWTTNCSQIDSELHKNRSYLCNTFEFNDTDDGTEFIYTFCLGCEYRDYLHAITICKRFSDPSKILDL